MHGYEHMDKIRTITNSTTLLLIEALLIIMNNEKLIDGEQLKLTIEILLVFSAVIQSMI